MKKTYSFEYEDASASKQIIIYGAGVYGEIALRGLESLGIKPNCYCDRALVGEKVFGYPVISPDELKDHTEDIVLIASAEYFSDMQSNLEKSGFKCSYDICNFFELHISEDCLSSWAKEKLHNKEIYIEAVENDLHAEKEIVISHLDMTVTECCTLKCLNCSALMQYYKNPKNISADDCTIELDRILSAVGRLSELRLLGGEPFINKKLYKIITKCIKEPKIGAIAIYTNGTIIPDEKTMEALHNDKVKLHISNYGINSAKVRDLKEKLDERGIRYFCRQYDEWQDGGDLSFRNDEEETLKNRFGYY